MAFSEAEVGVRVEALEDVAVVVGGLRGGVEYYRMCGLLVRLGYGK